MHLITLKNNKDHKLVKDVILHPLKVNLDDGTGGILVEALRKDWEDVYGKDREFAMQYFSVTDSGLARDENQWHLHYDQEDRFIIASGEVVVSVADYRKESDTYGLLNLFHINATVDPFLVLIPKGTLHGFLIVSKESGVLLNYPTKLYNPEDELRIPYGEANIKTSTGEDFSWDLVRKDFQHLKK